MKGFVISMLIAVCFLYGVFALTPTTWSADARVAFSIALSVVSVLIGIINACVTTEAHIEAKYNTQIPKSQIKHIPTPKRKDELG